MVYKPYATKSTRILGKNHPVKGPTIQAWFWYLFKRLNLGNLVLIASYSDAEISISGRILVTLPIEKQKSNWKIIK